MQPDEFLRLAKKSKLDQLQSAWAEAVDAGAANLETFTRVAAVVVERGHAELAESLLWYLADALSEAGQHEQALEAVRRAGRLLPQSNVLRDLLADLYPVTCEPRPDLLTDRAANGCYLLAQPPGVFALYFPHGGSVTLTVGDDRPRRMRVRWFDPARAEFTTDEVTDCRGTVPVAAPGGGTGLVLIEAAG